MPGGHEHLEERRTWLRELIIQGGMALSPLTSLLKPCSTQSMDVDPMVSMYESASVLRNNANVVPFAPQSQGYVARVQAHM